MSSAVVHRAGAVRQFATFHVGGLYFGVDVVKVQEVLAAQPMTSVPQAHGVVRGLINLRGQIVTAIDMRRRLGLEPPAGGEAPMNVVLRSEEGAVSLLVDQIGDVVEVPAQESDAPPPNLAPEWRELIEAVFPMADRLLLVLACERAVELPAA